MSIFIFHRYSTMLLENMIMEFNWNLINDVQKDLSIVNDVKPENDYLEIDLDEYERDILTLLTMESISNDSNSILSFQGIKRKLNTHQQILSRSLKRLEEKGFLRKLNNDYVLTEKAYFYIKTQYSHFQNLSCEDKNAGLQTNYGTNLSSEEFLTALRGTWFLDFRYIGWFKGLDFVRLEWLTDSKKFEAKATYKNGIISAETSKLAPEISETELVEKDRKFNDKLMKKLVKSTPTSKQFYYLNNYMINESKDKLYENFA